jgi:NADH dehydrogenase
MTPQKILLIGGSGFIGRAVAEQLARAGHSTIVPTRQLGRAKHLLVLPACDVVEADVHDPAALSSLMTGVDGVVNLVGILAGNFEREHVALPRLVAETCVKKGVHKLIQMSALNAAPDAPSAYLQSRARGEAAVMDVARVNPSLQLTILRPSVVFGEHDNFINMLARLAGLFPVIPLGSASAKFQPVWVHDVARAAVLALERPTFAGRIHELGGPRVYTMRELLDFAMRRIDVSRPVIPLPGPLAFAQALAFEWPPGKWLGAALGVTLTRDNVRSMSLPNTTSAPFPPELGSPTSLEAAFDLQAGRDRYNDFRHRAGR